MRLFYHCYDHNRPSGGQKDTYQHVDVLNRLGYEAYAVHTAPGFRLNWFENTTAVIDAATFRSMHDASLDYVVLPEDLGAAILDYPGKKVVFNKNVYLGCRALHPSGVDPYQTPDVVGIMSVSEHNARLLRLAYPGKPISVVRYDVRAERFPFRPLSAKKPQIACLPKAAGQVGVLYHTLRARALSRHNRLSSFKWVVLDGMDERQISKTLEESLVLVFLSIEEGLPRVPLEAMCAGCLVAAYSAGALRECLPRGCGFEYGDIPRLVEYIEEIGARYPDDLPKGDTLVAQRENVASIYSAANQARDVEAAWDGFLSGQPRHTSFGATPSTESISTS